MLIEMVNGGVEKNIATRCKARKGFFHTVLQ